MAKKAHEKTDAEWAAEWDARQIMDSMIIQADKTRFAAAIEAAKRLAKEEDEQAEAMRKVSEMTA